MQGVPERILARVQGRVIPQGDCLISTCTRHGTRGYRSITFSEGGERAQMLVHRVAWIGVNGPISDGMTVHHRCFNTSCVNVEHMEHMELMDNHENARRTGGADWPIGTCKRGHDDSVHLRPVRSNGGRGCLQCKRDRDAARDQRAEKRARAERRRKEDADS